MLCTSLRRRPSVSSAVPILKASPGLNLRERNLQTHDIALTIPSRSQHPIDTGQVLRLLLLTPSMVADDRLSDTLKRIERFNALTGGKDLAMLFLLQPASSPKHSHGPSTSSLDLSAYTRMTSTLLMHQDSSLGAIPLLPLHSLLSLSSTLQICIQRYSKPPAKQVQQPDAALDILPMCSAATPMSRQTTYVLTDHYRSLREVAEAAVNAAHELELADADPKIKGSAMTRGFEGSLAWSRLVMAIGEREARGVVDFWTTEWVAD